MPTSIKYLTIAALFVTLSGCVVIKGEHGWVDDNWEEEQRQNREAIARLELGMERNDVITRMNTPNYSEAFSREGDEYRVLFFRTQHRHSDGRTTRDETTPLIFKNDNLIGWGHEVLAAIPNYRSTEFGDSAF